MNLMLFLLAGYDTSSNALAYCIYMLTIHPEEQEKVRMEMADVFQHYVSNLTVTQLQYPYRVSGVTKL